MGNAAGRSVAAGNSAAHRRAYHIDGIPDGPVDEETARHTTAQNPTDDISTAPHADTVREPGARLSITVAVGTVFRGTATSAQIYHRRGIVCVVRVVTTLVQSAPTDRRLLLISQFAVM